jgi:hypothetical protein
MGVRSMKERDLACGQAYSLAPDPFLLECGDCRAGSISSSPPVFDSQLVGQDSLILKSAAVCRR